MFFFFTMFRSFSRTWELERRGQRSPRRLRTIAMGIVLFVRAARAMSMLKTSSNSRCSSEVTYVLEEVLHSDQGSSVSVGGMMSLSSSNTSASRASLTIVSTLACLNKEETVKYVKYNYMNLYRQKGT